MFLKWEVGPVSPFETPPNANRMGYRAHHMAVKQESINFKESISNRTHSLTTVPIPLNWNIVNKDIYILNHVLVHF